LANNFSRIRPDDDGAAVADVAVTDAEAGETSWIVGANGNIARDVGQLCTPAFHLSVIIGYRSPTDVSESEILPMRVVVSGPAVTVSVPSMAAADLPKMPADADSELSAQYRCCKRIVRREDHQVALRIQLRVRLTLTVAGIRPTWISLAAAALPEASTDV
jgi:hypothetical protein